MTGLIILNWNGWKDTIECLESIYNSNSDVFFVIVADNCSTDDSVEKIYDWLNLNKINSTILSEGDKLNKDVDQRSCILYKMNKNYGFAKGNNKAALLIEYVEGLDSFLLLNNDTIVEPDFLCNLRLFKKQHPTYVALMPQIRYYSDPNIIWNCGGQIRFSLRKYDYSNVSFDLIKEKEYIPITFISGCALFVDRQIINNDKRILPESFFFGGEDLEFSTIMKIEKQKMACVLSSVIYHKVGRSSKKTINSELGSLYYGYLLLFINSRKYSTRFYYLFWKLIYSSFIIFRLLPRYDINVVRDLIRYLWVISKNKDFVTFEDFSKLRIRNDIRINNE
jgi:GT2 family glycosyltransferase